MITESDLKPGQVYEVKNQGTAITPERKKVTVVWVGVGMVWYSRAGGIITGSTTIERFLEVLNQ